MRRLPKETHFSKATNAMEPNPYEPPTPQLADTDAPLVAEEIGRPIWGPWMTILLTLAGGVIFTVVQLVVVVPFFIIEVSRGLNWRDDAAVTSLLTSGLMLAFCTLASTPVCVAFFGLITHLRTGNAWTYLGIDRPSLGQIARWCLLFIPLVLAFDVVTYYTGQEIVGEFMVNIYETSGFFPLFVLAVVVGAPVSEEIVFRGFLFRGLAESKMGPVGAAIISSLLWAVIHLQYDLFFIGIIFVAGLFLAYVRHKTGSTTVAIVLHGLMNLWATIQVVGKVEWLGV